jgi:hypothetical protein
VCHEDLSTAQQQWRDSRPRSIDRTIIFVHIGRTAGTTLNRILRRIYPEERTYAFPSGDIEGSVLAFGSLPVEERRRFRLLKGHLLFGIHEAVPRPFTYITLVRDPVDRLISSYFYIRKRPTHRLHERLWSSGMSFENFVRSGITLETDNWQTRAIAGAQQDFGCCSDETLAQAKRNIVDYFSVCGIMERFDETLVLLKRELAWKTTSLYYARENTLRRPRVLDAPRSWIEAAEGQNPLDLELYAFARSRLERLVAEDAALTTELERFRRWNARYEPILHAVLRARIIKGLLKGRLRARTHSPAR